MSTIARVSSRIPSLVGRTHEERVVIRALPKVVVLYPTMLAALVCGIIGMTWPDQPQVVILLGLAFLCLLAVNLIVLTFDFPRMTAVAAILGLIGLGLLLVVINRHVDLVTPTLLMLNRVNFRANGEFYFGLAGILLSVYLVAWIVSQFDYWELTPNELRHRHGPFGDTERYPAPNIKLDVELHDVFEYLLLRTGRLIIYPQGERRALVLDNVFRIRNVERRVKHLLGAMEVRIDDDR